MLSGIGRNWDNTAKLTGVRFGKLRVPAFCTNHTPTMSITATNINAFIRTAQEKPL